MVYYLAFERTDGTMDNPFHSLDGKVRAKQVARQIAQQPCFDCVAIWVEDDQGNGVAKFVLPVEPKGV